MERNGLELDSIFDATDKTIDQNLQEFLSLQEIQIGVANTLSFEKIYTGHESLSPQRSMHSDDRKASKEYHVNDSSASTGNFKTVKEVYHIDKVHEGSQIYNDSEFMDDLSQQEFDFPSYMKGDPISDQELTPGQLLPGLVKINVLLTEKGYLPLTLTASDVNSSTKTVSVSAVNTWVDCLSSCIQEMGERLEKQQRAVQSVSLSVRTGKQSYNSLLDRNEALEEKLKEAQKKISLAEMQKSLLVDQNSSRTKIRKSEEGDGKRLAKGYDHQVQESERRVRQREGEIERLKLKIEAVAVKERATAARHREALSMWRSGAVLSSSSAPAGTAVSPKIASATASSPIRRLAPSSSFSSPPSKTYVSPRADKKETATPSSRLRSQRDSISHRESTGHRESMSHRDSISSTQKAPVGSDDVSAWDVIEALDTQRAALEKRNEELSEQLADMGRALVGGGSSLWTRHSSKDATSTPTYDIFNDFDESQLGMGIGLGVRGDEGDTGTPRRKGRESSLLSATTPTAAKMYDHITEQQKKIESMESRCDKAKERYEESERLNTALRGRIQEVQEELDSVRLDLSSRPTVKQWTQKQKELSECESKLHDLIVMRRESAELMGDRKNMTVKQKVLMDKRNFELGLWVLDSLPHEVTKNSLKAVCRELGLTDIGDIQPSIIKLKTVVGAVPRMERFITEVSTYVFRREEEREKRKRQREWEAGRDQERSSTGSGSGPGSGAPKSMDQVYPLLERWYLDLETLEILTDFSERVVEAVRANDPKAQIGQDKDTPRSTPPSPSRPVPFDPTHVLGLIKDLSAFQLSCLHTDRAYKSAEALLQDRPDELLNRTVAHVKYLFGVPSLEGLLPRMNQVYLSAEEAKSFLNTMRDLLQVEKRGIAGEGSDSDLFSEITRRLSASTSGTTSFPRKSYVAPEEL